MSSRRDSKRVLIMSGCYPGLLQIRPEIKSLVDLAIKKIIEVSYKNSRKNKDAGEWIWRLELLNSLPDPILTKKLFQRSGWEEGIKELKHKNGTTKYIFAPWLLRSVKVKNAQKQKTYEQYKAWWATYAAKNDKIYSEL